MLADDSGMSIEEFMGRQSSEIGKFLFAIQDEFIVACSNLSSEDLDFLDLDQVNDVFEKVLELNPIEGFFELEKKSPAGIVIRKIQETIREDKEPTEDLSGIYTPDGGSDSNSKSNE